MARRLFLGVDIGTSLVKAVAFDEGGRVVGLASEAVPLLRPRPQHAEQDTGRVLAAVDAVVHQVDDQVDGEVRLVALTAQGDGCWLLDQNGVPVAPGITWLDGRAAEVVQSWQDDGTAAEIGRRTGTSVFPGTQACLLSWLDSHEPQLLDRAATAAYAKDVVFQALTGERSTDLSDASVVFGSPPVGANESDYDKELLALCNLEHRAGLLAPVAAPLPAAPALSSAGLLADTTVTAGPYDVPACEVGVGVSQVGDAVLVLGTALVCSGPVDIAMESHKLDRGGLLIRTPARSGWSRMLPAMAGTTSLDWALRLLGLHQEDLEPLLQRSRPGSGGLRVLPYFSPSGERAPFVDPAATGQLLGLSLNTTPEDVLRAVCESLAHAARQCLDPLGAAGTIVACGGGVRSRTLLEIIASTVNRPLLVASGQVGARGAVLSGLGALPASDDVDVSTWSLVAETIDPVPALMRVAEDGYVHFLRDQDEARARWRLDPPQRLRSSAADFST